MDPASLTLSTTLIAAAITLCAGFVKGAVGFGMPMIMISGMASIMPVETALAALIIPTLISNGWQVVRQGLTPALASLKRFRLYIVTTLIFIAFGAQLVRVLPQQILFLIIGIPVVIFTLIQLLGWQFTVPKHRQKLAEMLIGSGAGFIGGMSGVWGPPLVAYLTAINTPKNEHIRAQGLVYGLGAVALALAHLKSGVLSAVTLPLSAAMVVPAMTGMGLGLLLHDRLPQATFRRLTMVVLIIAGLNLIRRAAIG